MLDELIAQFNTAQFQKRMRDRWDSVDDHLEKIRLRQELCLEVQGPIIAKYGYKVTTQAVSRVSSQIMTLMKGDPVISAKGALNNWLVAHLDWEGWRYGYDGLHLDNAALQFTRASYRVCRTELHDTAAIRGMERCRGAMVEAHQALYEAVYPGIRQHEWFEVLGQDNIRKSLETGIVMLHAESLETGEVVGYISCTEGADEAQFLGSWSVLGEPLQSFQVARDGNGQLRVEGVFALIAGSGVLAPHGRGLEAKIASSADGKRVGAVWLSITGPGSISCKCKGFNETEWKSEVQARRVGAGVQDEGPHAKVNHVVVMPGHSCRGVGRLLFEDLLAHLNRASPLAAADIRLSVADANARAISWYLKLGFTIVEVKLTRLATLKLGHVPMVFLTMQRRRGAACGPWERFFAREVSGEKVVLLPEASPPSFVSLMNLRVMMTIPPTTIRGFDPASGTHRLEDGRTMDLSEALAHGLALFERPLHVILSRPSK